ncbi:hypothetical protein VPH35_015177 [Triticum aestivum]
MMMITRARWRCAVLLKMAKFRSKGDVFHPVPVAGDRSQPVRSVCGTHHAANKILLYRQWKKAGGESQKEKLAPMWLFRKGGGGDGQLRSVFVNRVCGKTTNTRFPTNLEFWAFVKRVSYMHGLVGGAKQDFVRLGRFSGLWRSRSVCSPYPNNALGAVV